MHALDLVVCFARGNYINGVFMQPRESVLYIHHANACGVGNIRVVYEKKDCGKA